MRSPKLLVWAAILALLGVACGSTDESRHTASATASGGTEPELPVPDPIQGCVPSCNPPGISQPGPLSPGPYETQLFFGGEMVITLDEPWSGDEDSTGQLSLKLVDSTSDDVVVFWEDVYPVENGRRVRGVPMTVDGFLEWLEQDPRLDTSKPNPGTIGSDLPATIVDVTISSKATNEVPGCPTVCVAWLGFPQWEESWVILLGQVQRFYLSDVMYGGKMHLFIAGMQVDPADLETFLPRGEDLIATVQVPATPA